MILIDFIAAHKCVFLYAAWSTLFLIGLFLFTQLFQAIQKMESELFSFASTFLLVKKYKINNHKLHTMFTKLVQLFSFPVLVTHIIHLNLLKQTCNLKETMEDGYSSCIHWVSISFQLIYQTGWNPAAVRGAVTEAMRGKQRKMNWQHFVVQNNTVGQCFCDSWGVWEGTFASPLDVLQLNDPFMRKVKRKFKRQTEIPTVPRTRHGYSKTSGFPVLQWICLMNCTFVCEY